MSKTPDVAPDQLIQSAWGNEVRDRSCQVFATSTELNTWAAPDGAFAVTVADYTLWQRRAAAWRPTYTKGRFSGTTDASGNVTVTHGLLGTPVPVLVTPVTGHSIVNVTATTATTFTAQCRGATGTPVASGAVAFSWWCSL